MLFLESYRKTLNKSLSVKGLFAETTLYKYIRNDADFKDDIESIELSTIHQCEVNLSALTNSEDEKIQLAAIDKVLNSKIGKKYSNFAKPDDKPTINIESDTIEYTINK